MVSEPLTSWADLWALAPKYSGKIVFVDFDVDVLGAALKYKGYSVNSTDPDELNQAKDALLEIKPHLLAFAPTDITKPMIKGEAAITVDYDYDIAAAADKEPSIQWVAPVRGHARLPGRLAGDQGHRPAARGGDVHELPPRAQGLRRLHQHHRLRLRDASRPSPTSSQSIVNNPSLKYDEASLQTVEFEKFLGAEATKLRSQIWEEVKAA